MWTAVFVATFIGVHNFKKTGPIWDTWDEIAQYKLVYGLLSGIFVWIAFVSLTFRFAKITVFLVPALMWMALRWLEDAVSAFRAFSTSLSRLLWVGPTTLKKLRETRNDLHSRVINLAVGTLGLRRNTFWKAEVGRKVESKVIGRVAPSIFHCEGGGREIGTKRYDCMIK